MAKKKAAKKSTALAVRPKAKAAPKIEILDPKGLLPVPQSSQLGELATIGGLGLVELKLTDAEEAVLSEPVNPSEIRFKPAKKDGPPIIPYLPHIVYSRWLSRAFGRTGWSIVQAAAPKKVDNLVLVPYLLYVHGIPVAFATGEQEYYETNKQQTYGDVIESTVASALRRCAKRLQIGLEMWDKEWLKQHAIPPGERGQQRRAAEPQPEYFDAEPVYDQPSAPVDSPVITKKQWERIGQIIERAGRNESEVKLWIKKRYGVKNLVDVKQSDYAAICAALEGRGSLNFPGDGQ